MIKLSANVSKKYPIANVEFSSRSCSAGIEVEADSSASPEDVLKKFEGLYELLVRAVDQQLQVSRPATADGTKEQSSGASVASQQPAAPAAATVPLTGPAALDTERAPAKAAVEEHNTPIAPAQLADEGIPPPPPVTQNQRATIQMMAGERGMDASALADFLAQRFGVGGPKELNCTQASFAIDLLKAIKRK